MPLLVFWYIKFIKNLFDPYLARKILKSCSRVDKVVDGFVNVERVNDPGDIGYHVGLEIPFACLEFFGCIDEVGIAYAFYNALGICLIENLKAVSKQSKRSEAEDTFLSLTIAMR